LEDANLGETRASTRDRGKATPTPYSNHAALILADDNLYMSPPTVAAEKSGFDENIN
jgi:hypothetical protein